MKKRSEDTPDWHEQRNRIIGLGESSIRKNYYPELQRRMKELEQKNADLNAAYEDLSSKDEELRQNYEELSSKEHELRESEEKYRAVVTSSLDGIVIIRDGVIRFVNPKAAELLGGGVAEFAGRPYLDYIHPEERPTVGEIYRKRILGEPIPSVYETVLVNRNGDPVDVELNAGIIAFEGAAADLVYIRDIRERKRSQKALEQATKKLNLLNYVTFNDIRNLIFALAGYHQLVESEAGTAGSPVRPLLEREDDLLKRITESLKFAQTYQDLGLKTAKWQNVSQVFLMAISHLDFSKIRHSVTTGGLEVFADPLLEQVFQILADNTVVHSRTGTQVTLGFKPEDDGSVTLFFEDNGAGIPDDSKQKIFSPDYQKNKSVGLFLAREILDITEITIGETGTPGKGARFEMNVPKGAFRFIPEPPGGGAADPLHPDGPAPG